MVAQIRHIAHIRVNDYVDRKSRSRGAAAPFYLDFLETGLLSAICVLQLCTIMSGSHNETRQAHATKDRDTRCLCLQGSSSVGIMRISSPGSIETTTATGLKRKYNNLPENASILRVITNATHEPKRCQAYDKTSLHPHHITSTDAHQSCDVSTIASSTYLSFLSLISLA